MNPVRQFAHFMPPCLESMTFIAYEQIFDVHFATEVPCAVHTAQGASVAE